MQGKYLITTDNWFTAPDGKEYKAVWGNVEILEDKFLGVTTNRNSSNWFAKVGSEENHIIIAGCQIHYAARCETKPNTSDVENYVTGDNGCKRFETPTRIFIVE